MYLNLGYMSQKELTFVDVFVLQLAKQQKFEDCSEALSYHDIRLQAMLDLGYLKVIKGKKGDSLMSRIRIDKPGEDVLSNIEIVEVTENDIKLFDWIKKIYLEMDKKLGNQKKTKMFIALFRAHSGITLNRLATLMSQFVNDADNMEFNFCLEYALFKPQNVYNTKFNLDESRLYQYYLKHQDDFDKSFESL